MTATGVRTASEGRGRLRFTLIFGALLPIACLVVDPFVFRASTILMDLGPPMLDSFRVVGYSATALGVASLLIWLRLRRPSGLLAGLLAGGATFGVCLAVVLLPYSLMGLALVIGIFGFVPFVTAGVFAREAAAAWRESAAGPRARAWAATGFLIACVAPWGFQLGVHGTIRPPKNPCIVWTSEIRPLLVGGATRMTIGEQPNSDCYATRWAARDFAWSTSDTQVVRITTDGSVTGLAPGVFKLTATRDDEKMSTEGYVLPAGWTVEIDPVSATVHVGESVIFNVMAKDPAGHALPGIPFSIYTPQFGKYGPDRETPLVEKWSYQHERAPVSIRTVRAGTTTLKGAIAGQVASASLTVLEVATP